MAIVLSPLQDCPLATPLTLRIHFLKFIHLTLIILDHHLKNGFTKQKIRSFVNDPPIQCSKSSAYARAHGYQLSTEMSRHSLNISMLWYLLFSIYFRVKKTNSNIDHNVRELNANSGCRRWNSEPELSRFRIPYWDVYIVDAEV